MPTSAGRFRVTSPGASFSSSFVIDQITYSFQGIFSGVAIQSCEGVMLLTFADVDDLTSTQLFSGVIGRTTAKITMANGVEISGSLNNPIPIGNTVAGSGRWAF
ncbi:MAG: hypothetical protein J3R72DRAFT_266557 [Linnemannia gamsii]|nr:MAG: hypothetical protein J3R72DRAFT_266557 [Linnemannia gamsii]